MVASREPPVLAPEAEEAMRQGWQSTQSSAGLSPRLLFSWPVAVAAGFLLRVLMIGSKSLWLDEAMSLNVTQAGLSAWLAGTAEAYHPPLYYAFLYYWIQLGQSEGVLRLSSALFGVLAIPLAYLLARGLKGKGVALSTAWLVALSPLLVWYSQEFRSYSLLVCLALLSSLAFVRLLVRPQVGWWLLYVLSTAAAFYTHYDAILVLPIQFALLLALLAQQRVRGAGIGAMLAAWPVIAVVYWPWLNSPAATNFVAFIGQNGGYAGMLLAERTGMGLPTASVIVAGIALLGMTLLLAGWLLIRKRGLWPAIYRSPLVRAVVLAAFILLLVLSVWPRGYSVKRLAVVDLPYVCLAVAWFWPLESRLSKSLAALLLLSAMATVVNVVVIPKDQWRETVRYLNSVYQPDDVIWIAPGYDNLPFDYYNRGRLPVTEINAPQDVDVAAITPPGERIWLVYNDTPSNLFGIGRQLETRLESQLERGDEWTAHRVRAVLFIHRSP